MYVVNREATGDTPVIHRSLFKREEFKRAYEEFSLLEKNELPAKLIIMIISPDFNEDIELFTYGSFKSDLPF